jgi:hypothetical protein
MVGFYRRETDIFRVFANPPDVHGRSMFTAESAKAAQPLESWETKLISAEGRVDIYISRYPDPTEVKDTYFTCERVSVVHLTDEKGKQPGIRGNESLQEAGLVKDLVQEFGLGDSN